MPGSMPYSLEKGPYLSVVEDYVNGGGRQRVLDVLQALRAGMGIDQLPAWDSVHLDGGPYTTQQLRDHFKRDWLGYTPDGQGGWNAPAPFDAAAAPTTGFWQGWHGDCESALRQTLIRACEVSLGLRAGKAPSDPDPWVDPEQTQQHWWIELFWRCPIPWFEGWVTWRRHDSGTRGGQVTVLISTPSHGHPLRNTPLRTEVKADYASPPRPSSTSQGMWVVSQPYHQPRVVVLSLPSPSGTMRLPTLALAYRSVGAPVVVNPAEWEGGVRDQPTRWQPHQT